MVAHQLVRTCNQITDSKEILTAAAGNGLKMAKLDKNVEPKLHQIDEDCNCLLTLCGNEYMCGGDN